MTASAWRPTTPEALPGLLAGWLAADGGIVRVALDGPSCAAPEDLVARVIEALRVRGRAAAHVRAASFWRDASLRLEHGHQDVDSYPTWLDADALQREVLAPVVERHCYLPSLRDPATNRSTRAAPQPLADGGVLMVSGAFLLGRGLTFDRSIHLALSPAARARRTSASDAWTLPAFDGYDATAQSADVVIKLDDPRHPAVRRPASGR